MPDSPQWTASRWRDGNTESIKLFSGEKPLSFETVFGLMQSDADFAGWYSALLASLPFSAFFWEHPPLTAANFAKHAEFVIVDAPLLAKVQPDANPFRDYFKGDEIVTFRNLGGDATLIVPSPGDSLPGYAHLAVFLRNARSRQVVSMWQSVGRAVRQSLSDEPLWLSTSGLGVAWLHIRLDGTPKYYQHGPYKYAAPAVGPSLS